MIPSCPTEVQSGPTAATKRPAAADELGLEATFRSGRLAVLSVRLDQAVASACRAQLRELLDRPQHRIDGLQPCRASQRDGG
jgi:hypothetical protein